MVPSNNTATVFDVFSKLHEINVLEKTGNPRQVNDAVEKFNVWLKAWTGVHLRCWWEPEQEEWILQDTLLYAREQEENNG